MASKRGRPARPRNERLRQVLKTRKVSQTQLAELEGVTREAVRQWCLKGVPHYRIAQVAEHLSVPKSWLTGL
jgi:transcriptional regulator with XRE-family HTH domain